MNGGRRVLGIAATALLAGLLSGCDPAPSAWRSELVSANATGTDSGNASSTGPVFSPDGTKVAFTSSAGNLGPTDTNGLSDVYIRDLTTGLTTLVSVNAAGTDSGNGVASSPVFSSDGAKVAFNSSASNLGPPDSDVPNDTLSSDVFVRDLTTGTTTMISRNPAGTDSGAGPSGGPVFSPDGTKLLFSNFNGGLGPPASPQFNLYIRDLTTDAISLVTVNATGTDGGNRPTSTAPGSYVFSADSSKVAFTTQASNLGPVDSDRPAGSGDDDVYVRDLVAETTTLVSTNATGTDSGNGRSGGPVFNSDGTAVAFTSSANDLGPTDSSRGTGSTANQDVYLRNLATATTTLVSANAADTDSGDRQSSAPAIDPSGTRIAFTSSASNLGPTDTHATADIYLRNLTSASTSLVSSNASGADSGTGSSTGAQFGPGGGTIAFLSSAADLGPRDTNICTSPTPPAICTDVYLRNLATGTTELITASSDGRDAGNGPTLPGFMFSPSGDQIAFVSQGTNFGPTDTNNATDVYVATIRHADLTVALAAAPEPAASAGQLTYSVRVDNDGPDIADDVTGTVVLPEGTTFVSASATSGSCVAPTPEQPRVVTCALGDLGSGAGHEITVVASVSAPEGSTLTAVAAGGSNTVDPDGTDNVASIDTTVVAPAT